MKFTRAKSLTRWSVQGFTLIEMLIVIAIIALLILLFMFGFQRNLFRGRDAKRKSDLQKIKVAFEDYYNDYNCYPGSSILDNCGGAQLRPYLSDIPCDPLDDSPYLYLPVQGNQCGGYRILTKLEDTKDAAITSVGCDPTAGCGYGFGPGIQLYNYGISSGTTVYNDGSGQVGDGTIYACAPGGVCNVYDDPVGQGCPISFMVPDCESRCGNSLLWCAH